MEVKRTATLPSNCNGRPAIPLEEKMVYDLVLNHYAPARKRYDAVIERAKEVCQRKESDGWTDVICHIDIKYSSSDFYLTAKITFDQNRKELFVSSNDAGDSTFLHNNLYYTMLAYDTNINNVDTTKYVADQWYDFQEVVKQLREKEKQEVENQNRIDRIAYLEKRVDELERILADATNEEEMEDED